MLFYLQQFVLLPNFVPSANYCLQTLGHLLEIFAHSLAQVDDVGSYGTISLIRVH